MNDLLQGFLPEHIVKEWRRGQRLKCIYCKGNYATVGCVGQKCKKTFHLPCGLKNGSLHQFYGSFSSFCQDHRPVQAPLAGGAGGGVADECGVCLEELEEVNTVNAKHHTLQYCGGCGAGSALGSLLQRLVPPGLHRAHG